MVFAIDAKRLLLCPLRNLLRLLQLKRLINHKQISRLFPNFCNRFRRNFNHTIFKTQCFFITRNRNFCCGRNCKSVRFQTCRNSFSFFSKIKCVGRISFFSISPFTLTIWRSRFGFINSNAIHIHPFSDFIQTLVCLFMPFSIWSRSDIQQ